MKKVTCIIILTCLIISCYAQNNYYFDGIGFDYKKNKLFSQKIENGITYIFSNNIEIRKFKMEEDHKMDATQFVNRWANSVEENITEKIVQRSTIMDTTIGVAAIKVKFINFEYSKKYFRRIYAYTYNNYMIAIIINGKINDDVNQVLNSFWFIPEN